MSKHYGLIIPGQHKKQAATPAIREITRPSVFDESSDSDREAPPQLKLKSAPIAPGAMEIRLARRQQQKALEEDPTIYQYDELYDEMEAKREDEKQTISNEPKKPKYIGRLLECAERRKLENERRIERQVQMEREQEGEEFKDKESFVTTAYRKKLEELRILEEQEKRDDYLEAIGDVTKQKDLDGFYRHLYEQKTGTTKAVKKPELPIEIEKENENVISYKPIKPLNTQQRAYRKRHLSDEEECEQKDADTKKAHLPNNIDADSDFSIDSSSTDDEQDNTCEDAKDRTKKIVADKKSESLEKVVKLEEIKKGEKDKKNEVAKETALASPQKKDKSKIWKKRTVGDVFDAAVKRYYERKAARSA